MENSSGKNSTLVNIIDIIFTICLGIFVAISHGENDFVGTHIFRFCACSFLAFGLLLYTLKNPTLKTALIDLIIKVIPITVISIVVAKLTNVVDLNGFYSIFYLLFIMLLYWILNQKYNWRVNGENIRCSSREYLKQKHNTIVSLLPTLLIVIALIVAGICNFSTLGLVISLSIAASMEFLIVFIADNIPPNKPNHRTFP